jgi:hypothetical protein
MLIKMPNTNPNSQHKRRLIQKGSFHSLGGPVSRKAAKVPTNAHKMASGKRFTILMNCSPSESREGTENFMNFF